MVAHPSEPIALLLADVDGTLVTHDKVLTDRAIEATKKLTEAGIAFAITSGRPPRGMAMLIEPLKLIHPLAAFNGGLMVKPDLSIIDQRTLRDDVAQRAIASLMTANLSVWVYRGNDWLVLDPKGPHVAREQFTVRFPPTVVSSFEGHVNEVAKVVGVSDDFAAVARTETLIQTQFKETVSATRSQPYYLDITHPDANKGWVVGWLAKKMNLRPGQIATIGDMPNDVLMFQQSGYSVAMGNASPDVQQHASAVTSSNEEEGFATAVEQFILGGGKGV